MTTIALRKDHQESKVDVQQIFAPPSPEFDAFLRGPSAPGISSRNLNWKGVVLEEHTAPEGDWPVTHLPQHLLVMWRGKRSTGECSEDGSTFRPYINLPGTFDFFPAGPAPAVRSHGQTDFLLCAFDPRFVDQLREEMGRQTGRELHSQRGFQDRALHQLVLLLLEEIGKGAQSERLYADHLVHALTSRLLALATDEKADCRSFKSSLPRHILGRVTERMRDLRANLDLQALADEAGYSQSHFLRMFQKTTGQTPHQYRIKLRVARAQELLRRRNMSLIDIAFYCGFSSHSHMTTVFRQLLGVTPSELRRDLEHSV